MEKKEQLVKKENNNFKDGSNEEDEREKEIEKITTLRSKFTKLFKNFLDNKDAQCVCFREIQQEEKVKWKQKVPKTYEGDASPR